jgi:hypothetical protein
MLLKFQEMELTLNVKLENPQISIGKKSYIEYIVSA